MMNWKLEIKYSLLAFLIVPVFFACLIWPTGWLANHVPNGILGLFLMIAYLLVILVLTISYLKWILRLYKNSKKDSDEVPDDDPLLK